MNIFNSLGSNYDWRYVLKSLAPAKPEAKQRLMQLLEDKYEGQAILTSQGRAALKLGLSLLDLPQGSGVAVTGFTCIAVIDAIEKQNLKPIYIDIDPLTLNFTAETLEQKIKSNKDIKAVIIQNTLGYACDIEKILKVCKKNKIVLIEDLAHSIGTIYPNGKEAGTVGNIVALSFSQDKAIDTVSGGALIIKNQELRIKNYEKYLAKSNLQDKLYPLLTFIIRKTYQAGIGKVLHIFFKTLHLLTDPMRNLDQQSLSDWHAGLALSEFKNLGKNVLHRRHIAQIYADNLDKNVLSKKITQLVPSGTNLRFPIFVRDRDTLVQHLKKNGVYVSDIWYDAPVAPKKYLGLARYPKEMCPHGEKVANSILNLPTHINVSENDARHISSLINKWLQHKQ